MHTQKNEPEAPYAIRCCDCGAGRKLILEWVVRYICRTQ